MIYQILFVFALLIVALNDASGWGWLKQGTLTKKEVEATEKWDRGIEWDDRKPCCTKELPIGWYKAYKKVGDAWEFFGVFGVKDGVIDLSTVTGFKLGDTYIIYGMTHERMEFYGSSSMIKNLDSLKAMKGTEFHFIRSSEWDKSLLISPRKHVATMHETPHHESMREDVSMRDGPTDPPTGKDVAGRDPPTGQSAVQDVPSTNEGDKETNGWNFKKKMIIFGLIAVAAVLALCACCVFGWCYLKKKEEKEMNSCKV